jgi:hypothetical protein
MRKTAFWAFLFSVGFFSQVSIAQTMTARVPMSEVAGEELVQISINGSGPYDFVVDTGANVTMVKSQLLRKLNITDDELVTIVTATGVTHLQRAIAESITIAGLTVHHIEVDTLEGGEAGALSARAQGILGENFLKNFDILIDNEKQTLVLDRTSNLADTLAGEHLHLSRFGRFNDEPTPDRIMVKLTVPSFLQKLLVFLVDSGSSAAILYPAPGQRDMALRAMQSSQHRELRDLNGSRKCQVQKTTLKLGSVAFGGIDLVACEGLTRNQMDADGLLPTRAFHQFFISHSGGYVIANPSPVHNSGEVAGEHSFVHAPF